MSDPKDFLTRWSRRKRQATGAGPDSVSDSTRLQEASLADGEKQTDENKKKIAATDPKDTAPEPVFDISKLPPIESITATTDIRGFLAPGVPVELTRAALRRVWVADPAIRDFIGIAENQWDFTKSGGVPGSDLLAPTGDIGRMVAEIFGDSPAKEPPDKLAASDALSLPVPDEKNAPAKKVEAKAASHHNVNPVNEPSEASTEKNPKRLSDQFTVAEHNQNDVATQRDNAEHKTLPQPPKRGHGGALPI